MKKIFIALAIVIFSNQFLMAQGDGPRAHLFAPTGVWAVNPKYLHLEQNLLPNGNILVKDADLSIDIFPTTFVYSFRIKNQFARVFVNANPGSLIAKINAAPFAYEEDIHASGFSDGYVAFEMGLIGAPALNAIEFSEHQPQFSLTGIFKYWYSGTYDSEKLINLGTNRSTFEIGTAMAIPFHKEISQHATWLEIMPSIQLFTPNNDPTRSSTAQQLKQEPLFILENHLTHNFTKKLWAGIDLRYQLGGTTKADGVSDDNQINMLGGGLNIGYQILTPLSFFAGYDLVFAGDNDITSSMIRVSLVFAYINLKRLNSNIN